MIYLNTNNTQTISLIPKGNILSTLLANLKIKIVNETTKEVTTLTASSISTIKDLTYIQITSLSSVLELNTFFNLTIFDVTDNYIFFKELAYCTNQNLNTLTINQNEYSSVQLTNNDYITI
jgi:hypothetical protein